MVNTTGLREVGTNEDIVELTAGETRGCVDVLLKVEPCLIEIQEGASQKFEHFQLQAKARFWHFSLQAKAKIWH